MIFYGCATTFDGYYYDLEKARSSENDIYNQYNQLFTLHLCYEIIAEWNFIVFNTCKWHFGAISRETHDALNAEGKSMKDYENNCYKFILNLVKELAKDYDVQYQQMEEFARWNLPEEIASEWIDIWGEENE